MTADRWSFGDVEKFDSKPQSLRYPLDNWRFRFDEPPTGESLALGFRGNLLDLLQLQPKDRSESAGHSQDASNSPPELEADQERRSAFRHAPAVHNVMIGWWHQGAFVVFEASLINLSSGGALLELKECPSRSQPVWLCLGEPKLPDLAQGRVLDVSVNAAGTHLVRLLFHSPCPGAFLDAAGKQAGG